MKNRESAAEFIDERLRKYSADSNIRGLPFIGDGMKRSHRKAIDGVMRRGESAGFDTVERIAAAAASITDYHHGVASLEGTIVKLAQTFAGSNNIPLLEKFGQFGNRLNGKPSGTRYIKTKLSTIFRQLFKKEDDLIFERHISNGMEIEPKYFAPILPMLLVNGAEGMGTGHASDILSYNPEELRLAILKILDGKKIKPNTLVPWFRGFKGQVSRDATTGQVTFEGVYSIKEGRTPALNITELPLGVQCDAYKQTLLKLEDSGIVTDHDDLSDEKSGFDYIIRVPRATLAKTDPELKKLFKLISKTTENLTVWNGAGVVQRFECIEDLLAHWVDWRVLRYEERRNALIKKTTADIAWANLKIKFIKYYLKNTSYFRDTPNKELIAKIIADGFDRHDELLGMPMRNLTHDKILDLEKDVADLIAALAALKADTATEMFKRELKALKL